MSTYVPPPQGSALPDIAEPILPGPDSPGALTAEEAADLGVAPPQKPRSLLRRGWEVFAENKLALASVVLVLLIILFCFVGPLIYHTDQVAHEPRPTAVPAPGASTCSAATTSATTCSAG